MDYFTHGLPFGGVGDSGIGAYPGRHGFETFSHRKSVYTRRFAAFDPSLRYPPFTSIKLKVMKWLLGA